MYIAQCIKKLESELEHKLDAARRTQHALKEIEEQMVQLKNEVEMLEFALTQLRTLETFKSN